jgi:hypothetical protein
LGKGFAGFFLFPGVGAFSGTAVMARRTGRRDRGVRGIPGTVADRGVGKARMGAGLGAVSAGFAARASGREGETVARV